MRVRVHVCTHKVFASEALPPLRAALASARNACVGELGSGKSVGAGGAADVLIQSHALLGALASQVLSGSSGAELAPLAEIIDWSVKHALELCLREAPTVVGEASDVNRSRTRRKRKGDEVRSAATAGTALSVGCVRIALSAIAERPVPTMASDPAVASAAVRVLRVLAPKASGLAEDWMAHAMRLACIGWKAGSSDSLTKATVELLTPENTPQLVSALAADPQARVCGHVSRPAPRACVWACVETFQ